MNTPPLTLDAQIDAAHKAAQEAENDALQVIERLRKIPGAEPLTRARRGFGGLPNPWAPGAENLTIQQAILRADPALASFLARRAGKTLPGTDPGAQEREAKRQASIQAMQAKTEAMRQQRQARQERQRQIELFGRQHEGRTVFW